MAYAGFDEWEDGQEGGEGDKAANENFIAEFICSNFFLMFAYIKVVTYYKIKAYMVNKETKQYWPLFIVDFFIATSKPKHVKSYYIIFV